MRTIIFARNEVIKTRQNSGFWVGFLGFAGLMAVIFGSIRFASARRASMAEFALPNAWTQIIGGAGVMTAFFAAIVVVLLVANEFTWRTARQNVIDGLSKEEFFTAKLLLVPAIGLLFFSTLVLVGGGFAFSGSHADPGPLVRVADLEMMAGALIGLLGWSALAFLLAITIRSSGPAIGAFFLYFIMEQIVRQLIAQTGEAVAAMTRYLPTAVFMSLWQASSYRAATPRSGQLASIAPPVLMLVSVVYIVFFLVVSFVLYRRRDL